MSSFAVNAVNSHYMNKSACKFFQILFFIVTYVGVTLLFWCPKICWKWWLEKPTFLSLIDWGGRSLLVMMTSRVTPGEWAHSCTYCRNPNDASKSESSRDGKSSIFSTCTLRSLLMASGSENGEIHPWNERNSLINRFNVGLWFRSVDNDDDNVRQTSWWLYACWQMLKSRQLLDVVRWV